jgi:hypothetical protein
LLGNVWNIITGKVYRENQVSSKAVGCSYEILEGLQVRGLLLSWAKAVIWSVDGTVKSLTINSKVPEWEAAAKDEIKVRRLACFIAWLLTTRAIERNPSWFRDAKGIEDALSRQIRDDFVWTRRKLFPDDDPIVAAAIERTKHANFNMFHPVLHRFVTNPAAVNEISEHEDGADASGLLPNRRSINMASGRIDPTKFHVETFGAFQDVLGIASTGGLNEKSLRNSLTFTATIVSSIISVGEYLTMLSNLDASTAELPL